MAAESRSGLGSESPQGAGGKGADLDFRLLFESAPGACLVLSPELVIEAATDAYLGATMTRRDDIVGRCLFEVFPDNPADADASGVRNLRASLERVIRTGQPDTMAVQKYDIRRPDAQGAGFEERYWSPVNTPVFDASGRLRHIMHRVEDVTDYVRVEAEARRGSATAAALTAKTVAMEAEVVRRAQEIQLANRELRAMHEQLERRVAERTADLQRSKAQLEAEMLARRNATSEVARLEGKLLQMQRLDAIGKLAGGIAHDFNNILTVILGSAAIARTELPPDAPILGELDNIRAAGERASRLTQQLLTFSRKDLHEATSVDLNEIVTRMQSMLTRLVGEDVEIVVRCAADLAPVEADPSEIEQVVLNLVVNSRDAMPDGGRILIETANVAFDEAQAARLVDAAPGAYAMLAVTDTGCGMDAETQHRMFEPFFTTKGFGKGTGLGLATVFGIVTSSGGHIAVRSEIGTGTTMEAYFPQGTAPSTPCIPTPARAEPARARADETLVLVEDDDRVRGVARRILTGAGYRLLEAAGPEEALAIARNPDIAFDGLITDVVMPRMGGRQLAELMTAIRPGLAVLFMSGYSDDLVLQRGVRASQFTFVRKPLDPDAFTAKVRDVLDRQPAR